MKGLEKIYWKSHPSWLGNIDCVRFNTLPHWKKWQFANHDRPIKFLTICIHFLNKRRGYTQVLKKKEVVYNFWPPLVWGASISCLHSLLHGKDKEDFLRQYVTWTKIAILENWYNNVPRCFHYSKSWKCTPKDSVAERRQKRWAVLGEM